MTGTATRYLYLVRHAEALADESGLTENGRRQAVLLGQRLRDIPFSAVHHGPLPRAAQTAHLIGDLLKNVPLHISDAAGDYVPDVPEREELPANSAHFLLRFLDQVTDEERERGPVLARQALEQLGTKIKQLVMVPGATHLFEEPGALEQVARRPFHCRIARHSRPLRRSQAPAGCDRRSNSARLARDP